MALLWHFGAEEQCSLKQILWLPTLSPSCHISHVWFWFMLNRFFSHQQLWSAYVSRGFKIPKGVWGSELGISVPEYLTSCTERGCFDPGKHIKFHLNLPQNFVWGRCRGLSIKCSDLLILFCCVRKISPADIVGKKCVLNPWVLSVVIKLPSTILSLILLSTSKWWDIVLHSRATLDGGK